MHFTVKQNKKRSIDNIELTFLCSHIYIYNISPSMNLRTFDYVTETRVM